MAQGDRYYKRSPSLSSAIEDGDYRPVPAVRLLPSSQIISQHPLTSGVSEIKNLWRFFAHPWAKLSEITSR